MPKLGFCWKFFRAYPVRNLIRVNVGHHRLIGMGHQCFMSNPRETITRRAITLEGVCRSIVRTVVFRRDPPHACTMNFSLRNEAALITSTTHHQSVASRVRPPRSTANGVTAVAELITGLVIHGSCGVWTGGSPY